MAKEPTKKTVRVRRVSAAPSVNKLTAITIEGFKSIREERTLLLSALNILAGSNSSGKSSFIQPLLLLKQTMEASYDPGPLLINGANVKFTAFSQIFSKSNNKNEIQMGFKNSEGNTTQLYFDLDEKQQLQIKENIYYTGKEKDVISISSNFEQIFKILDKVDDFFPKELIKEFKSRLNVRRERSFLNIAMGETIISRFGDDFCSKISRNMIHVPGLRGNPERSYPKTSIGNNYLGTFDFYVASIIAEWAETGNSKLKELGEQLQKLGLTGKITAKKLDDTRVELQVGRLPISSNETNDLVSIADVGFGVSQVLPVLVALLVAEPGQVVYIEQPETHLHPKAQRAMAGIFAAAANREATVIVETHSLIFVRAIQTLVAKKEVKKELVKLHWVTRDEKGDTNVDTADLDASGAYGDWPQDFEATEMESEMAYIEAAEAVLFKT